VGISYILAANKFSGPLFRINVTLRRVAAGDYTLRTRFRARDEAFHEVAQNFNLMMDGLSNNVKKDLTIINQFEEKLQSLPQQEGIKEITSLLENWKKEKKNLITPPEQKTSPAKG